MFLFRKSLEIPSAEKALKGRDAPIPTSTHHTVLKTPLKPPFPDHIEVIELALGCFWGAERLFWRLDGVYSTAVGYAGGHTPNPTYEEVCSGKTGHTEVVMVAYDPAIISLERILQTFWEGHNPTQGMRQGNDVGTQYRSAIYTHSDAQLEAAKASKAAYNKALGEKGYPAITTEIRPSEAFYYAEAYHQQYLDKNPNGYCGLGGTGVSCPIGAKA